MKYLRRNLSEYIKIADKQEIPGNFASVIGEYKDPLTSKTGFYKSNKFFFGEPDLRELLGSIILKLIKVPCADIQLIYDDTRYNNNDDNNNNNNGCLSMSILKPNEHFIEANHFIELEEKNDFAIGIDKYINEDIFYYKRVLPNVPIEFWDKRKDFLIKYAFISAFLGNDDIKSDNCQIIFNEEDQSVRNPEYYDMGMSFTGITKWRTFYEGKTDKEVLLEIYTKYPSKVKDISLNISKYITKEQVQDILNEEIFSELSEKTRICNELGEKINMINKENEILYKQINKNNGFSINHKELIKTFQRTSVKLKKQSKIIMKKLKEEILGRNEENEI